MTADMDTFKSTTGCVGLFTFFDGEVQSRRSYSYGPDQAGPLGSKRKNRYGHRSQDLKVLVNKDKIEFINIF